MPQGAGQIRDPGNLTGRARSDLDNPMFEKEETVVMPPYSTNVVTKLELVTKTYPRVLKKLAIKAGNADGESTRVSFIRSTGLQVSTANDLVLSVSQTYSSTTIAGSYTFESAALIEANQACYLSATKISAAQMGIQVWAIFTTDPTQIALARKNN